MAITTTNQPIIVLGAARSGTKMFRDALASHPSLAAVPHDINFIWKYGNYHIQHDELTPNDLSPSKTAFIQQFFERIRQRQPNVRVVEKTISNTIRVDYVRQVFPGCQFIHLIRDGRDVAVSSMEQWQAPLDYQRVSGKLKYFPLKALPTYALQYVQSYLSRKFTNQNRVTTWGVTLKDLPELIEKYTLLEVCGLQWSRCVDAALADLETIPEANKIEVRYEYFVQNPLEEIERILNFLGLEMTQEVTTHAHQKIKASHINKWEDKLQPDELARLLSHIASTLQKLGYTSTTRSDEHPEPLAQTVLTPSPSTELEPSQII